MSGIHFDLDDLGGGRFRLTQYLKPVRYESPGRVLLPITDQLKATGDPAFPIGSDELLQFRIKDKLSGNAPVLYFGKGASEVRLRPLNAGNVNGVVTGNSITFPGAWPNADWRLTLGGHRLEGEVILRAGHPQTFAFRIDSHIGLDGKLETPDFRILDPVLFNPVSGLALPLKWLTSVQGGKTILSVTLPSGDWAGWTLDPTLTLQPDATAGIDVALYSSAPTTNYGTADYWIMRGNGATGYSSILKFDLSSLAGATITDATLYSTCWLSSAAGHTFELARVLSGNSDWTEAAACWSYRVGTTAWAGSAGCKTSGTDFAATAMYSGDPGTGLVEHSFALGVTEFGLMRDTNYGLAGHGMVEADGYRYYRSSDYGTAAERPKLVVNYTAAGAVIPVFINQYRQRVN